MKRRAMMTLRRQWQGKLNCRVARSTRRTSKGSSGLTLRLRTLRKYANVFCYSVVVSKDQGVVYYDSLVNTLYIMTCVGHSRYALLYIKLILIAVNLHSFHRFINHLTQACGVLFLKRTDNVLALIDSVSLSGLDQLHTFIPIIL